MIFNFEIICRLHLLATKKICVMVIISFDLKKKLLLRIKEQGLAKKILFGLIGKSYSFTYKTESSTPCSWICKTVCFTNQTLSLMCKIILDVFSIAYLSYSSSQSVVIAIGIPNKPLRYILKKRVYICADCFKLCLPFV